MEPRGIASRRLYGDLQSCVSASQTGGHSQAASDKCLSTAVRTHAPDDGPEDHETTQARPCVTGRARKGLCVLLLLIRRSKREMAPHVCRTRLSRDAISKQPSVISLEPPGDTPPPWGNTRVSTKEEKDAGSVYPSDLTVRVLI